MTRVEAVPANLRKLLGDLTEMSVLAPFSLGGGTSLALRFGHRMSIDIDLFTLLEFDSALLLNQLLPDKKAEAQHFLVLMYEITN